MAPTWISICSFYCYFISIVSNRKIIIVRLITKPISFIHNCRTFVSISNKHCLLIFPRSSDKYLCTICNIEIVLQNLKIYAWYKRIRIWTCEKVNYITKLTFLSSPTSIDLVHHPEGIIKMNQATLWRRVPKTSIPAACVPIIMIFIVALITTTIFIS